MKEQPSREGLISEKQAEIVENWEELTQRAETRKTNLEQSRELQKFLADLRDLVRTKTISISHKVRVSQTYSQSKIKHF